MPRKGFTRRDFLGGAVGLCAAAPLGLGKAIRSRPFLSGFAQPRSRLPNPYVENCKPIVAVVRGTDFKAMLAKGMEMLGGFARFGSDKAVHLKPNFVAPSPYPVTTDGDSLVATAELLQKEGFNDVTIAEWGSMGGRNSVIPTLAFYRYRLPDKAEAGGFKILDLWKDEVVQVKDERWTAMPFCGVFKSAYETPLIIDMPTIKQHSVLQFTCALKNIMGQIDKQARMDMHRMGPAYEKEDRETKLKMAHLSVAELAHAVNPELTIIDARQIIGKSHHFTSGGIGFDANRVIISGDPLAADLVAANVLAEFYDGFDISVTDLTFNYAAALGLGVNDPEGIVIKDVSA